MKLLKLDWLYFKITTVLLMGKVAIQQGKESKINLENMCVYLAIVRNMAKKNNKNVNLLIGQANLMTYLSRHSSTCTG